ncbi:MAG: MBL fold metallo-hydrolase [Phycisphaerae bacterium]|nr:MBL fold metallo-hydrolase [Phycisphaerae bacterium]
MLTCSLQSGSNGNAIYVEADGVRLLFDAGISGRQARLRLAAHGRDIREVDALLLSHAHSDHTRCAGIYQRLFQIPIYATVATERAMAPYVGKVHDLRHFGPGETLEFGPLTVHTLPTPHDADDSVAFIIEHDQKRLGVFTDLGHPFERLSTALRDLDAVYLESNYDPRLLATGSYPPELKARIRGDGGHLSNEEAAALLKGCGRGRLRWAALAHLSEENNHPEVALETHRRVLGQDYPLTVASRYHVSELLRV